MLSEWPRLYPGVVELVKLLRHHARLAVVTGTWRENVDAVLGAAGLGESFEIVVGKEDVRAPKPNPEAYQLALSRLQLAPKKAFAIEDSPNGLSAARAAGIPCFAIGHRRPAGDWVGDATYVERLSEIPGLLQLPA
jgi:HAD superfamily hydrolase (TIGR01509 family)